jgi:hypothetical protein
MSYLIFEITDPVTSKKHPVILAGGGLWHGDVLLYDFSLMHQGLAGRMECDWRSKGPVYHLDQGEVTTAEQVRALLPGIKPAAVQSGVVAPIALAPQ